MENIETTLWYNGKLVRPFEPADSEHVFKWILIEKEGALILLAMPKDTDLDFHKELRDKVCSLKKWPQDKLKVLGGGVRFDQKILHRSTYFGEMPEEYRAECLELLKLN